MPSTGHENVQGTSMTTVTCVGVRWAWLSLLAAEIALTAFFLVWIIVTSSRAGVKVWKTSTLASMLTIDEHARKAIVQNMGGTSNHRNEEEGYVSLRLVDDQLVLAGTKKGKCG